MPSVYYCMVTKMLNEYGEVEIRFFQVVADLPDGNERCLGFFADEEEAASYVRDNLEQYLQHGRFDSLVILACTTGRGRLRATVQTFTLRSA